MSEFTVRYNLNDIKKAIGEALEEFYVKRIEKLNELNLKKVLKRKNPYLFQSYGFTTAQEVVENVLSAFMSSSDETIFGNIFFEKLARTSSGGRKSSADSIDVEVWEDDDKVKLFAIKSGPHVFNAQSRKRQEQAFQEAINRLKNEVNSIEAIVAYGYGSKRKSNPKKPRNYREVAGQAFWEEITGDKDFFIKIVDWINNKPDKYLKKYKNAYVATVNKLSKELLNDFCKDNGQIDWEKLVRLTCEKPVTKKTK